jgi:lysophospholipase L1-like esterase
VVAPPPVQIPKGPLAPKFMDAGVKSTGLAAAYREICAELGCDFFDAGSVAIASPIDGIHLDPDQHERLANSLAAVVAALPAFSSA